MGPKNWPPTGSQIALGILLLPLGGLLHLYDKCRVKWYEHRPRQFNWLEMEGVKNRMMDLFATMASSIEYGFEQNRIARTYETFTKDGEFNEAMKGAVWFRIRPSYVPRELFMQQLHDQIVARRDEFRTNWFQVGLDEDGRLGVQLTRATIDTTPPRPLRERAKAVRLNFGYRDGD